MIKERIFNINKIYFAIYNDITDSIEVYIEKN